MERFEEARRWFLQALRDAKASEHSLASGDYEWSCFQAQQAAEKAAKALLYAHGASAWGHSVTELLEYLKRFENVPEELVAVAHELDRHYIPSRYPNAYASGYPGMYYDKQAAEKCVSQAKTFIEWVRKCLERLGLRL